MQLTPACDLSKHSGPLPSPRDVSGIALFMVLAAIGILSFLVTEFSYVARVNAQMAQDAQDQVKAHYLAKSGLKISLLRLKAYQTLRSAIGSGSGGSGSSSNPLAGAIPKGVMEKIWNFPFIYPLPTLPEMTISEKDQINAFQKDSGLEGHFSAVIESEDSKYNLNMLLPQFAAPAPSSSPSSSPSPGSSPSPNPSPRASPSPSTSFDPEQQRKSLHDYLQQIIANKVIDDEDFAHWYRDFKVDDLVTNIASWEDRGYNTNEAIPTDQLFPKRAPFYSLTELHMVPLIDDELYNLLTPGLTVNPTPGININSMQELMLRALLPQITPDEVTDFFKYRDDPTTDNVFKQPQDFYDYLQKNIAFFRGDKSAVQKFQQDLQTRKIQLVTDETDFKITVQAQVNQAVRTFEFWVSLTGTSSPTPSPSHSPSGTPSPPPGSTNPANQVPDAGLKITFMRIL